MKKVLTMTAVACFLAVSVLGCKSNDNGNNGTDGSGQGSSMNSSGTNSSGGSNGSMSQ